jgi:hypothetical protein
VAPVKKQATWQVIPPETPVPPKSDLEIWVCDECRPTNAQKIGPYQFKGCSHEGRSVHVCQASCERYPCSKLPAGEIRNGGMAELREDEMLAKAAKGDFSQSPPKEKKAPCSSMWRRTTVEAPIYNHTNVFSVDLCIWKCEKNCCSLQPEMDKLYFQAPSDMRVSHFVMVGEGNEMFENGATFQSMERRAAAVARLRG